MMIILSVAGLGNEVKFKLRLPPFLGMCSQSIAQKISLISLLRYVIFVSVRYGDQLMFKIIIIIFLKKQ